jgi:hypothetical protein
MSLYECMSCHRVSEGAVSHEQWCPQHPDARVIRLEKRVDELEEELRKR